MTNQETARNPGELERILIGRQHEGDIDGMVALYEQAAVLDYGGDEPAVGIDEIRHVFEGFVASGQRFEHGRSRPPVVSGDLALTSTVLPDGDITTEVARRQDNGNWLWVIDKFSIL